MKQESEVTVLIIDENPQVSQMLARGLRRVSGIRVVGETSNVMLGAELAHQLAPQVILADFRRSGPPPLETYRWIKRVSPASHIVAHTSYVTNGQGQALRDAGVATCYLKGMSIAKLGEEIMKTALTGDDRVGAGGIRRGPGKGGQ